MYLKCEYLSFFAETTPKSREIEYDSNKMSRIFMKIEDNFIGFDKILLFHKKNVHYSGPCSRACNQREMCDIMRRCVQFSKKIVQQLRLRDGLLHYIQDPFVVGSLKEGTRLFSLGKFLIASISLHSLNYPIFIYR